MFGWPDVSFGEDGALTLVFGHSLPGAWSDHGARFNLSVETERAFEGRVLEDRGPLYCVSELSQYEGGTLVQASSVQGSSVYGEDLSSTFEIDGRGYGWFVPHADEEWSFRLDATNGTILTSQGDESNLSRELRVPAETVHGLAPGRYTAVVEEIVGKRQASASYVVADLTPSIAHALNGTTTNTSSG